MSTTLVTTLIIAGSLTLVVSGVVMLITGVIKLPFSLLGSALAALVKPFKKLFAKGGDKAEAKAAKAEAKKKSGVEEVAPAGVPAFAAASA